MAQVLVVEDDPTIREVIAYQVGRQGHEVRTAPDGVTALQHVREHAPQLIILDLMLPRLAGLDLLRVVRQDSQVPVIVISARDSEPDRLAGFDLGADDYLTKPFSVRELIARVAAVLRRSASVDTPPHGPVAATVATESGLEIDLEGHVVRRHGQVLPLSPRQFDLLAYLARHPNQARSRDQILEAVWGYTYGGETRTIDVHVHGLRRLLEDTPTQPRHLLTVRQYGYKFVP